MGKIGALAGLDRQKLHVISPYLKQQGLKHSRAIQLCVYRCIYVKSAFSKDDGNQALLGLPHAGEHQALHRAACLEDYMYYANPQFIPMSHCQVKHHTPGLQDLQGLSSKRKGKVSLEIAISSTFCSSTTTPSSPLASSW